ncbi:MAG: thioredoxin domain-containing protein [Bacteroidota bacterium]
MNEENQVTETLAPQKQSMAIPVAIIIGFGLIAGAIYFSGLQPASTGEATTVNNRQVVDTNVPNQGTINPITEDDHIRGNPNAPIMIVEYSDFDCPFCKAFHVTMNSIIEEYGPSGEVAWVYRHLPLEQLHPSAPFIAQASECVATLGGNEAFWTFSDLVFGERGTNEPTNVTRLSEFAETAGVDVTEYEACIESRETVALVDEDRENAAALGVSGTPHSFILVGDQQFPLNGARPYAEMQSYVSSLIQQINSVEGGTEVTEDPIDT